MVIGLIGAQNSHSEHFLEFLNKHKKHDGFSVGYIYGADDPEICARLVSDYGIVSCANEDEVIEKSDAVVITYRKGSLHYEPAMKVLSAGKPLFNDKPFTSNTEEAKKIVDFAKEKNILICGGSSVKCLEEFESIGKKIQPGDTVVISFPGDPGSEYDGYYFYGIHSVEACLKLLGINYTGVSSMRNGDMVVSAITYPDNKCVLITSPEYARLDITIIGKSETVHQDIVMNYQGIGPDEFCNMLKSNKMPREYNYYLTAVKLMTAIVESAGL